MPLAALVAPVLGAFGVSAGTASLIGAGVSVAGSLLGGHGGGGGNPAVSAANQAANTQLQMYQQTRQDLLPFASSGASAMSQLANIFGFGPNGGGPNAAAATSQLANFPGYQFGRDQGVQALDRSAASRGLLLSGAQLQDTQKFGTNYAMQQAWQPYVSGLEYASSLGENAAAQTGNNGASAAAGAAQSQLAGGSAALNQQTAIANNLQSGLAQYQLQNPSGTINSSGPSPSQLEGAGFTNTGYLPDDPPY